MSFPEKPQKAKLFFSIIYKDENHFDRALEVCKKSFGDFDFISDPLPFDQTTYYNKEMGEGLHRKFVTFTNLIERHEINKVKHEAFKIENEFKTNNSRTVNLDPGILTLENVCLSTFKNFGHRIYLGNSVYMEITLIYRDVGYKPLEWTFPDYRTQKIIDIFNGIRVKYKEQLRKLGIM